MSESEKVRSGILQRVHQNEIAGYTEYFNKIRESIKLNPTLMFYDLDKTNFGTFILESLFSLLFVCLTRGLKYFINSAEEINKKPSMTF